MRRAEGGDRRLRWFFFAPSPLTGAFLGSMSATAPALSDDIGVGYAGLGALFVAQTVGAALGAAAAGIWHWRLLRPSSAAGLAAAMALATPAANGPVVVGALLVLGGFGAYALNTTAQGELSAFGPGRRSRLIAIFHLWGGLGAFAFPALAGGLLALGAGWEAVYLAIGLALLVFAVGARDWRPAHPVRGLTGSGPRDVFRGRALAALVVAVLGLALQLGVLLWLPTIAHDRFGVSAAGASLFAGGYMLALLAARIAATMLLRRAGERPIMLAGAVTVIAGHVVLFAAPSVAALGLATALLGAGAGPLLPTGIARVAHWSANDRQSTAAVMSLASLSQIALPACVVAAQRLGLSLQEAASTTVVFGLVVLVAALRA